MKPSFDGLREQKLQEMAELVKSLADLSLELTTSNADDSEDELDLTAGGGSSPHPLMNAQALTSLPVLKAGGASAPSVMSASSATSAGKICRICVRDDVTVASFCGFLAHAICSACVVRLAIRQKKLDEPHDVTCEFCKKSLCVPMSQPEKPVAQAPVAGGASAPAVSLARSFEPFMVYCVVCWCAVNDTTSYCRVCDEPVCEMCAQVGRVSTIVPNEHVFCGYCVKDGFDNYNRLGGVASNKRAIEYRNPASSAPFLCQGACGENHRYDQLKACRKKKCRKLLCLSCSKTIRGKTYCHSCVPESK
jgi:hypothetical protein